MLSLSSVQLFLHLEDLSEAVTCLFCWLSAPAKNRRTKKCWINQMNKLEENECAHFFSEFNFVRLETSVLYYRGSYHPGVATTLYHQVFFHFPIYSLPFLSLISTLTCFQTWGLVTKRAQLLITSNYYLPSTPKDEKYDEGRPDRVIANKGC